MTLTSIIGIAIILSYVIIGLVVGFEGIQLQKVMYAVIVEAKILDKNIVW